MLHDGGVALAPGSDHDRRLTSGPKPFDVQAFVTQSHVEAFVGAILLGLAWIDVDGSRLGPA